jgi:hypothetical protein
MEMDPRRVRQSHASPPGDREPQPLDWAGLRARLSAARQLREALKRAERPCHAGSFDPVTAAAVAGWRRASGSPVNLELSGDSKAAGGMAGGSSKRS